MFIIDMQSNQKIQKNTTISKANTNDFELRTLKSAIANILKNHNVKDLGNSRLCQSLSCKCIAMEADFDILSANNKRTFSNSAEEKQKENDVSNTCLTVIKFLMLDGKNRIDRNLVSLFEESQKLLNKQRGPDEIMIQVIYPIYVELFEKRYRELKRNKNFTDTFRYDQRIEEVMILLI